MAHVWYGTVCEDASQCSRFHAKRRHSVRYPIACRSTGSYTLHFRLFDTTREVVQDLSSGPNSPDLEFMWTPAIVPDFFSSGKPGEHGVTFVCLIFHPVCAPLLIRL